MKALEYPKGTSGDGVRDLLQERMNSKGQVVLREKDVEALMGMVDYFVDRSFEYMRSNMSKETT